MFRGVTGECVRVRRTYLYVYAFECECVCVCVRVSAYLIILFRHAIDYD